MTFLLCNVAWMDQYRGRQPGGIPKRGGAYIGETGTGHEVCNFYPIGDHYYGYVRAPTDQIDLQRI